MIFTLSAEEAIRPSVRFDKRCTFVYSARVYPVSGFKVLLVRACKKTIYCGLGRAIGRPARVIKVKLLPPRLFLAVRWDNETGSPSPLLFHTRPAWTDLLLDKSKAI